MKGAYVWPSNIAYINADEIRDNYIRCVEYLFEHSSEFMVRQHDPSAIIDKVREFERVYNKKAMFGMLKGIRGNLAMELALLQGEGLYIHSFRRGVDELFLEKDQEKRAYDAHIQVQCFRIDGAAMIKAIIFDIGGVLTGLFGHPIL